MRFNTEEHKFVKIINIDILPGNDVAPPLELNKIYPLVSIIEDRKGNQHLNLGIESKYNYITSYETQEKLPDGDKIHYVHPSRAVVSDGVN